jgi:hypothetical protein
MGDLDWRFAISIGDLGFAMNHFIASSKNDHSGQTEKR